MWKLIDESFFTGFGVWRFPLKYKEDKDKDKERDNGRGVWTYV